MKQLNISIKQIGTPNTQAALAPNNTLELLAILMNYHLYDYENHDLKLALSQWLLEQPKDLFFELYAHKRSEMKEFISFHLKNQQEKYLTPFSKELLQQNDLVRQNDFVFCIPSKIPKAAFIKQQLEKWGIKTSGALTKKTTHTLLLPGVKYKEHVIYTEYEALLDYLTKNENTELVSSPFDEKETSNMIELLCSNNLGSIDLALQMIKNLERITQAFVSPLLAAYYMKKKSKSRFKTGTGWPLLKRVLEEHSTEHFIKKIKKEERISNVLNATIIAGFEVGPLIDVMMWHKETRKYELRSLGIHGLPFNKYYLPHFMRNLEAFKEHQKEQKVDRYHYITQLNVSGENLKNSDLWIFIEALEIEMLGLTNGNAAWEQYLKKGDSMLPDEMEMYNQLENPNIEQEANFQKEQINHAALKLNSFTTHVKTKNELKELVLLPCFETLNLSLGERGDYSQMFNQILNDLKKVKVLGLVSQKETGVKINIQQLLEGIELDNLTLFHTSLINVQYVKKNLKNFFGQIVSPDYLQAAGYIQGLAKLNQLILENEAKNK